MAIGGGGAETLAGSGVKGSRVRGGFGGVARGGGGGGRRRNDTSFIKQIASAL